jgi:hypothetical protein
LLNPGAPEWQPHIEHSIHACRHLSTLCAERPQFDRRQQALVSWKIQW